ncbi:MAG: homocysteine S-methyltransferase family protein [Planctomycetota bacterium]
MAECLRAGAHLVGGCCGTTPEHIRAVTGVLDKE